MILSIIAAVARNGAIGKDNRLPWHIAEDLHHFKELTWGHTIIMGRHTYESLPHGALPGRRNVVVSRTITQLDGCEVCPSLADALSACSSVPAKEEVFVIGGESLYRQTISKVSRLHLTLVDCAPTDADAFFPTIEEDRWREVGQEQHEGFSFVELRRTDGKQA